MFDELYDTKSPRWNKRCEYADPNRWCVQAINNNFSTAR